MNKRAPAARGHGITLLELLVAMAIAGLILSISFPSLSSGLEGLKLQTAGRQLASFLNMARARAERDQRPVELLIDPASSRLTASSEGQWERVFDLAAGLRIAEVWPAAETPARRFLLIPGVPPPRFRVRIVSSRGRSLAVEVDPIAGIPQFQEGN